MNGQRQFLVHNSWGGSWADHGFAYVSEAMVRQFIKNAYKVVVASATPAPAVPAPTSPGSPTSPAGLTDDDCAASQLVDSVSGKCTKMCPDDSRPADGKCPSPGATTPPASSSTSSAASPTSPPPRRGRRGQQ